ncbi:MAG: hypothetical protein R3C15_04540 [Thermoleophilia bacterium]
MTTKGTSYGRFLRALSSGNPTLALAAASELPQLDLADALALCLVLRRGDAARYSRAAVRWHARFCAEVRGLGVVESQLVLSALAALGGPDAGSAAHALVGLFESRDRGDLARVVGEACSSEATA